MKRITLILIILVILAILVVMVRYLTKLRLDSLPKAAIEPKKFLFVHHIQSPISLEGESPIWDNINWDTIQLFPQTARACYGGSERTLRVKAVYNREEIAFLLQFSDDTEDRYPPPNPDASALLFTPEQSLATVQMMGYGGQANIWQWVADRDAKKYIEGNETMNVVRELIASGPGTQTPFEKQRVVGKGIYRDGKWSVIFKRSLQSQQQGEFDFQPKEHKNIAFALWDGSKMESFSRKSISILRTLIMEKAS